MINTLLFIVLPYVAIVLLILGSVYRYKYSGFKVSSLSSQFLEGKNLFYGSVPFHWGLVFLFFGHLIAFLFPRAVILWNGMPVRLFILELSALAFAFLTLSGLLMLLIRRVSTPRLWFITNKMDLIVYLLLLVQIISGIWIAIAFRWGSNWFASVLSPFLKSIFFFNPDIAAVSALPLMIKVHIVSAFVMVGMIPFTRFMHFLVLPLAYIWRKYQVVIWNKKVKSISES
ncbi:MAG: respiratory nitrate reductase subunit gamma [Bacteroidales bacterium]|nr:respiratory nitrate reductase subunit gamma [Bacteroidales bacterium]MCF8343952.1 respiratory nitrate reductase subunit gamma [Bacteroidales bacterium]MCF8351196.1 respiratory nitrate reductase subunit gamma [Bacteroidales bacterium]MCF8375325.1 respiratory nitrate reductase subunit gamma [Bacteroidales bacterium]MCF8400181.1 respiratory nitrate reductase subunit gamma [Bacteroidales bacterium]